MTNYFYSKTIRLVVLLISCFSCATAFSQKFARHDVYLPDNGILTATVKVWPPYPFSIKKDNQAKWAEYEISDKFIFFSAPINTTKNSRECLFILLDVDGNPVDTLKLTQTGKLSTTASKLANGNAVGSKKASSSTKSSTGGQCAARTKKGTRCSRQASAGSIYCWQHKK